MLQNVDTWDGFLFVGYLFVAVFIHGMRKTWFVSVSFFIRLHLQDNRKHIHAYIHTQWIKNHLIITRLIVSYLRRYTLDKKFFFFYFKVFLPEIHIESEIHIEQYKWKRYRSKSTKALLIRKIWRLTRRYCCRKPSSFQNIV